jgi:hypothetical protein
LLFLKFCYYVQLKFTYFEFLREVRAQRRCYSQSSGGSRRRHRTQKDITNKRLEQRLRA